MEKVKQWEKKIPQKDKLIRLINIFMPNWQRASVTQGAAEMAYFMLLSLVPILLVVANIIPLLPMETGQVLSLAQNTVPADVYGIIEPTLVGYLESSSGGAISIGVIAAIWSASKIVSSLRKVLDEVYGTIETQNFIIDRILSMLVMLAIIIVIGVAFFIVVFGEQILSIVEGILGMSIPLVQQLLTFSWIPLGILLFLVFMIIYQFVPNHHLKIKTSVPGAIFSTIALVILSQFFSLVVSLMGGDAVANATFGSFIALMLFLYISNVIILLGALVNVIVFEWQNHESVHEYEVEHERLEKLEDSRWTGYPDESEYTILRRKLYKVSSLNEEEVEEAKEKQEKNKRPDPGE